ncbi:MAG: polysaccharide deacetylase family protein, partial [Acidimicrobiales bacterium]
MRASRAQRQARAADTEAARRAWPDGFQAALSISFDDARRSQIDLGLPVIDQLGILATFFVLPDGVEPARRGWLELVAAGQEIGNHTARHPCSANFSWSRHHAIEDLSLEDIAVEISDANAWIAETLGVEARAFAYPCGHTFVGRGRATESYVPLVADRFVAGRTFNDVATNSPVHGDLAQVRAMNSDGLTFEQLRPTLAATLDEGAWLVLGGHE